MLLMLAPMFQNANIAALIIPATMLGGAGRRGIGVFG
jgi:hypothetical protein